MYKLVTESNRAAFPRSGNLEAKNEFYSLDSVQRAGRSVPAFRGGSGESFGLEGAFRK